MKLTRITTSTRYMVVLIVTISILIMLGGYYYYSYEEQSIRESKHQEIEAIADLKISQIVQWRKERIADAKMLSHAPFFARGIKRWLENRNNRSLYKEIMERFAPAKTEFGYEEIYLVSPKGELLLAFDPQENVLNLVLRSKIIEAIQRQQITFTDFYYCPIHNKIHYDIIAPIIDDKNNTIAALILRVDPQEYLYPLIQSWPVPSRTSETLILRKDGDSVLFLNELRYRKNTALILHIPLSAKDVPAVRAVLGEKGIFEGVDYRGVPVLSDIEPIPDTPWFMIAKVNKSEIYAELWFRAVFISSFTIVLIFLFGIGLTLVYKNRQKNIYQELFIKEKELWANQEEYKTTLYSIGDAVMTTDAQGAIRQMNPVAERLTGWKELEAKGMQVEKVFAIINEETRKRVISTVERVLREGNIFGLANHTLLISKNGKETPIADSGAPIKSESGKITGVVLVFRDQTEERAARKNLLESELQFRNLFENSPVGKSMTGIDGSLHVNKSFCDMVGYSEEELKAKKWMDITHPEDIQKTTEIIQSLLEGKISRARFEKRYIHKNGNIIWADTSTYLQRDKNSTRQYFITTVANITERKHAEEEVQRFTKELEQRVLERTAELNTSVAQLEELNHIFVGRELRMVELKELITELERKLADIGTTKKK